MRESRFNIYLNTQDGTHLAFNSFSCGLAKLDVSYEKLIEQLPSLNSINPPKDELKDVFEKAVSGKFIVDNEYDELAEFIFKRNLQKYNIQSMGLTIAPTLNCNFKCVYCYENANTDVMTRETENNIIGFVNKQKNKLRKLSVSWYGGEPVLAFKNIERLSENFLRICKENNIKYNAFMVSNGSLLTDEIIYKMKENRINGIQITLDGMKEIQDARRASKNGISYFDTIMANIDKLIAFGIEVVIRINIDRNNESHIEELLTFLKEKFGSSKLIISFGQIYPYTDICKSIENDCFCNDEFANLKIKYYGLIEKYGFAEYNPYPYPQQKLNYCCAELFNSFVIDNQGYVYKCWNEIGFIHHSIGNLNDKNFNIVNTEHSSWILRDILKNEECRNCKILPLCLGGCPHIAAVRKQDNVCDLIKFNLQDILLKYYEYSRR